MCYIIYFEHRSAKTWRWKISKPAFLALKGFQKLLFWVAFVINVDHLKQATIHSLRIMETLGCELCYVSIETQERISSTSFIASNQIASRSDCHHGSGTIVVLLWLVFTVPFLFINFNFPLLRILICSKMYLLSVLYHTSTVRCPLPSGNIFDSLYPCSLRTMLPHRSWFHLSDVLSLNVQRKTGIDIHGVNIHLFSTCSYRKPCTSYWLQLPLKRLPLLFMSSSF